MIEESGVSKSSRHGAKRLVGYIAACKAYFNVPRGTDVLGDLKSVLEGLVTRA